MTLKRIVAVILATLVLAVVLGVVFAGLLLVRSPAPRQEAAPNIDGLKDVLERSARASLAAPDVTNAKLTVFAPKEAVEGETERIVRLASEAGGTAIRNTKGGEPEVLASIPDAQTGKFIRAVTGKAGGIPGSSGGQELIDIVITSSAISTPAP
jgi:hypothetical protein